MINMILSKWSNKLVNINSEQFRSKENVCSLCFIGAVRESELYEPIEDEHKGQTTFFSSYKQLLDFVDDCKDTIW